MVAVEVSSLFSPANIAGIRFPLDSASCPPLHLEPLENLSGIRAEEVLSSDAPLDTLVTTDGAVFKTTKELLADNTAGGAFGQIALALLLLGHGYTDECHNLVTPLSWPDDIHFAAGPSVYHQMAPDVRAYATYTHCLVHRREAFNLGEFGMMGFANANYWSSLVKQSDTSGLPHEEWHAEIVALAAKPEFHNVQAIQTWCQSHGFEAGKPASYFESRTIHDLCSRVQRDEESDTKGPDHEKLKDFAEQVVASEIRILMQSALRRAGIPVREEVTSN